MNHGLKYRDTASVALAMSGPFLWGLLGYLG